tara:strand:+ start:493 stop:612 length:120 start_codon:yes stop_codon:yes gene_type:complete
MLAVIANCPNRSTDGKGKFTLCGAKQGPHAFVEQIGCPI